MIDQSGVSPAIPKGGGQERGRGYSVQRDGEPRNGDDRTRISGGCNTKMSDGSISSGSSSTSGRDEGDGSECNDSNGATGATAAETRDESKNNGGRSNSSIRRGGGGGFGADEKDQRCSGHREAPQREQQNETADAAQDEDEREQERTRQLRVAQSLAMYREQVAAERRQQQVSGGPQNLLPRHDHTCREAQRARGMRARACVRTVRRLVILLCPQGGRYI